jgi:hypothetical protein
MKIIWVATTGNNTTGTGEREYPYASIERAIQDMEAGDQIRILDGTYIPTDSVVISGLEGSIFAENPDQVYIQPEKTRAHRACVAVVDAPRFLVQGINILQAADTTGNLIGLYVENVENFIAYTCNVSDFEVPSGTAHGIFASGALGRVEKCKIANFACAGGKLYGIQTYNIDVIDCEVMALSGAGDCEVVGIDVSDILPK